MKLYLNLFSSIFIGLLFMGSAYSQKDTISTDKLIIIKQYSPTVNDAFKIKQKPSEKDTIKQQRKTINYSFIDVPVASTFTPAKGTASGVRIPAPDKLYENYARFGAGNFSTILADFYSNFNLNRDRSLDIKFSHLSSQGGIEEVVLDDDFSNTSLGLNLTSKDRYFDWNSGVELNHREINYYGLSPELRTILSQDQINSIDPKQTYTTLEAFGGIQFDNGILREAKIKLQNFSDDYSNSEQLLSIEPSAVIPLRTQDLQIDADFTFLNGGFETVTFRDVELNYQQLQAGLNPFLNLNYDKVSVKLGAKAVLFNDFEQSSSDVFFYPDIEAKFLLNRESIAISLGVNGDLQQNSYEDLSVQNPFISPVQLIAPTDLQYNAFAGLSTKLLNNLALAAKVNYSSATNHAFFAANPSVEFVGRTPTQRNFDYQNSFRLLYGDLDVFSVSTDLAYQVESEFNIGLYGKFSSFSTSGIQEAFNLPEIELKAYADYNFTKNWNFSASLFYIGERNDIAEDITVFPAGNVTVNQSEIRTIDGYLDLNASIEYKINSRLSAFANANNLLNADYNRWQNFDVQGFQILGGLIYQFDW